MDQYDMFLRALYNVNPEMVECLYFLKNSQSNSTVKTFEDCASVEKDIHDRLDQAYFK